MAVKKGIPIFLSSKRLDNKTENTPRTAGGPGGRD